MKKYRTHNSWYVRSLKNNSFSQTVAGGHDQFQLFGQRLREGFPLALGAPNPWDNTSEAQLTWWFSKGIPPKMAFQIKDLYVESPGWNLNKFDLPFQERDQDQIHITHHTSLFLESGESDVSVSLFLFHRLYARQIFNDRTVSLESPPPRVDVSCTTQSRFQDGLQRIRAVSENRHDQSCIGESTHNWDIHSPHDESPSNPPWFWLCFPALIHLCRTLLNAVISAQEKGSTWWKAVALTMQMRPGGYVKFSLWPALTMDIAPLPFDQIPTNHLMLQFRQITWCFIDIQI